MSTLYKTPEIHMNTGTKYDESGYDKNGFNSLGVHIKTGTRFDESGFDKYRYDVNGFSSKGYDVIEYDRNGFNNNGINKMSYGKVCPSLHSYYLLINFKICLNR